MLADLLPRRSELRHGNTSVSLGGFDQYLQLLSEFTFNGFRYITPGASAAIQELTALNGARNPIVGACISTRLLVFAEARLAFQRMRDSRPGDLFGTPALAALERPWTGAVTADLLARMLIDADLFGNSYWVQPRRDLVRLDPCRTMIVTGSVEDDITGEAFGETLVGYAVTDKNGKELAFFTPDEVAHFRPLPDPEHQFRGRTWLSTVLPDVSADDQFTTFKHAFLKNGATPGLVVAFKDGISKEQFDAFMEKNDAAHKGVDKAFKTLYLGAGADVKVVGANFEQLAVKAVQGQGETRIAAAAGVPAAILGISEGLQGSQLNTGNYGAARRRFADGTMRPLWRSACAALEALVKSPGGDARLWYDDRDISFLQEDVKDAADIKQTEASALKSLVDAGFTWQSSIDAIATGDFSRLEHTGLFSVQLQPPGAQQQTPAAA